MGYSTRWRSQWRILKECICIWQFFIVLFSSTGYAVCSPCVLSCLWVILTGRYTGTAICSSYLWKPNATGMKHSELYSHVLYFHMIPGFYCPQGRPVHTSVLGEQSLYSCYPHQHTHTYFIALFPQQSGEGYTGKKDMDASFCLAMSHLRATAARELPWAGAWAGHKATGTTVSPIWSVFHCRLWLPLPHNLLPKATDWIWTFLPRDLLAAPPICTSKSIKCLYVMFCVFNQCY